MPSEPGLQDDLGSLGAPEPRLNAGQAFAPLRVLSLTGGGYRGLFTGRALVTLCESARHEGPLDAAIDVFAGTSIGGLMSCALAVGILPYRVLDAIDAHGPHVFKKQAAGTLRRLFFGTLYDTDNLSKAIDACLGNKASVRLSEIKKGLIVPAVDWTNGQVHVFASGFFGKAFASDATLKDVCLATAAAPTYFDPAQVDGKPMLDGGLAVNNPDTLVILELMRRLPSSIARMEMLSIGTAGYEAPRAAEKAKRSALGWAPDLATFMMDVQERTAAQQAKALLEDRYLRVNHHGEPVEAFMKLDAANSEAREKLMAAAVKTGKSAYKDNPEFIDRMFSSARG